MSIIINSFVYYIIIDFDHAQRKSYLLASNILMDMTVATLERYRQLEKAEFLSTPSISLRRSRPPI
jgi:hypothetical protein